MSSNYETRIAELEQEREILNDRARQNREEKERLDLTNIM